MRAKKKYIRNHKNPFQRKLAGVESERHTDIESESLIRTGQFASHIYGDDSIFRRFRSDERHSRAFRPCPFHLCIVSSSRFACVRRGWAGINTRRSRRRVAKVSFTSHLNKCRSFFTFFRYTRQRVRVCLPNSVPLLSFPASEGTGPSWKIFGQRMGYLGSTWHDCASYRREYF